MRHPVFETGVATNRHLLTQRCAGDSRRLLLFAPLRNRQDQLRERDALFFLAVLHHERAAIDYQNRKPGARSNAMLARGPCAAQREDEDGDHGDHRRERHDG